MKKRYWLFGWEDYEGSGPSSDFRKDFDSIEELQNYLDNTRPCLDNYEVLDLHARQWINIVFVPGKLLLEKQP